MGAKTGTIKGWEERSGIGYPDEWIEGWRDEKTTFIGGEFDQPEYTEFV